MRVKFGFTIHFLCVFNKLLIWKYFYGYITDFAFKKKIPAIKVPENKFLTVNAPIGLHTTVNC